MNLKIIFWNVRGMTNRDKRVVIKQSIACAFPDILCFQESKIQSMSDALLKEVSGLRPFNWLVLLSRGASGGILTVWDVDRVEVLEHEIRAFSIAIRCRLKWSAVEWVFVGVYNPVLGVEVDSFLGKLDDIKAHWDLPWCIGGDFNLVRFPRERNVGSRWDASMRKFGAFIDR